MLLLGGTKYNWLLASPPLHLPEFVFGMLAGKRFLAHENRAPTAIATPWRLAGPVAAIAIILADGSGWFPPSLLDHGLLAPLLAILFFSLARNNSGILGFLRWKPIVYLGEVATGFTYPIPLYSLDVSWSPGGWGFRGIPGNLRRGFRGAGHRRVAHF